jgi:WD40 repeat protein
MLILKGPAEPILALGFTPDAATLYASHYAAVGISAWNLADHTVRKVEVEGEQVFGEFPLHPGGRWAFAHRRAAPQSIALDLVSGKVKPIDATNPWGHLAVSPDGKRFATIALATGPARRGQSVYALCGWAMTAAGPKRAWELRSPDDALVWWITFVGNDTLVTEDKVPEQYSKAHKGYRPATRLAVRSAKNGKVTTTFDSPYEGFEPRHLFASPDGRWLVARRGTSLRVWDASDWENPPVVVPGNEDPRGHLMRAAAFHPSSRFLLLASDGPSVTAIDTATWKPAHRWNWKAGALRAVAVSSDGTLAAAAGPRGAVVVWDWDL